MRASGRSILLITRITGSRASSALRRTKRVWGSGPSLASTSSRMPSTIVSPRSTSPPKSECPGVSTMLSLTPLWRTAVFLARIVMPFSRSRSIESMTRSATSWFWRNAPDCHSIASTSVVLPWSTWATIATLRMSLRTAIRQLMLATGRESAHDLACRERLRQLVRLAGPEVDQVCVARFTRSRAYGRRRVMDLWIGARRVRMLVHEAVADTASEPAGERPGERGLGGGGDCVAMGLRGTGFRREHEGGADSRGARAGGEDACDVLGRRDAARGYEGQIGGRAPPFDPLERWGERLGPRGVAPAPGGRRPPPLDRERRGA